jgi:Domain of unknown function (DUF4417)
MTTLGPTSVARVGSTIGLGCQNCYFRNLCGGTYSDIDCLADCCQKPERCETCCPNSDHFAAVVQDAGGLDARHLWKVKQIKPQLPSYVPLIHNGWGRSSRLKSDLVALTTFDVVKPNQLSSIDTPHQLRARFKIAKDARVILISVGKDRDLERFWEYMEVSKFAERLAALGIEHITAPNFSFPLNSPRTEHIVNRMRSLKCAERLSVAGLSVIPHINCYNDTDWDCWRWLLSEHKHLNIVAMEFQTGLRTRCKAEWHLTQLERLKDNIGRDLHLVAIGARRHISLMSAFGKFTVVDSVPFVRSHKHRSGQNLPSGTIVWKQDPKRSVDDLLPSNIECARSSVLTRLGALANGAKNSHLQALAQPALIPVTRQLAFTWQEQAEPSAHEALLGKNPVPAINPVFRPL